MKKRGENKSIRKGNGKAHKLSQPQHSLNGIRAFLSEIERISYTPGFACFCTPGHNRGRGF